VKQYRFASHSPQEQRQRSNLGHIVEGLLLGVVGVLVVLDSTGAALWAATDWSILILVGGVLLLILV